MLWSCCDVMRLCFSIFLFCLYYFSCLFPPEKLDEMLASGQQEVVLRARPSDDFRAATVKQRPTSRRITQAEINVRQVSVLGRWQTWSWCWVYQIRSKTNEKLWDCSCCDQMKRSTVIHLQQVWATTVMSQFSCYGPVLHVFLGTVSELFDCTLSAICGQITIVFVLCVHSPCLSVRVWFPPRPQRRARCLYLEECPEPRVLVRHTYIQSSRLFAFFRVNMKFILGLYGVWVWVSLYL